MTPDPSARPIKLKHKALWALGNYDNVATEVIPTLGGVIVEAAGIAPGDRVLDVAAGSGNASLVAAVPGRERRGDRPHARAAGGRRARPRPRVSTSLAEGDAEHLPCEDGEFDAVLSCVGVMFAPFHQPVADELVRVIRPGGTDRADQLDAGGLHRPDVRDDEAVCAAPPPGSSPDRCGATRPTSASCFGDRVAALDRDREESTSTGSTACGVPRLLQELLRPDHRRVPEHRRRSGAGRGAGPDPRRSRPPVRCQDGTCPGSTCS